MMAMAAPWRPQRRSCVRGARFFGGAAASCAIALATLLVSPGTATSNDKREPTQVQLGAGLRADPGLAAIWSGSCGEAHALVGENTSAPGGSGAVAWLRGGARGSHGVIDLDRDAGSVRILAVSRMKGSVGVAAARTVDGGEIFEAYIGSDCGWGQAGPLLRRLEGLVQPAATEAVAAAQMVWSNGALHVFVEFKRYADRASEILHQTIPAGDVQATVGAVVFDALPQTSSQQRLVSAFAGRGMDEGGAYLCVSYVSVPTSLIPDGAGGSGSLRLVEVDPDGVVTSDAIAFVGNQVRVFAAGIVPLVDSRGRPLVILSWDPNSSGRSHVLRARIEEDGELTVGALPARHWQRRHVGQDGNVGFGAIGLSSAAKVIVWRESSPFVRRGLRGRLIAQEIDGHGRRVELIPLPSRAPKKRWAPFVVGRWGADEAFVAVAARRHGRKLLRLIVLSDRRSPFVWDEMRFRSLPVPLGATRVTGRGRSRVAVLVRTAGRSVRETLRVVEFDSEVSGAWVKRELNRLRMGRWRRL